MYPHSVVEALPPPAKASPFAMAASSGEPVGENSGMSHVGVQDVVAGLPGVTNAADLPSRDGTGKVGPAGVAAAVAKGAGVAAGKDLVAVTDTCTHMRIYVY